MFQLKATVLEDGDVIPLQYLGSCSTELSNATAEETMLFALANLGGEGGYAVRHGQPVSQFGLLSSGVDVLGGAFPCLWPYGEGCFHSQRHTPVSVAAHTRWALQYFDRRFRLHHSFIFVAFGLEQKRQALVSAKVQMSRSDFERSARLFSTITLADLRKAGEEEAQHRPITNPAIRHLKHKIHASSGNVIGSDQSRRRLRSQIWGTCAYLGPPTLWMTINPSDLHDPVLQVFAGEKIDMNNFNAAFGPAANRRVENVAKDPFAAAKFFNYIVLAILECVFGIDSRGFSIKSQHGILGRVSAYFGAVEAQNRGTLHLHLLVWLYDTPNPDEMHDLLQTEEYRSRVVSYIRETIRAHLPRFSEDIINAMASEAELAYSRPPHPDSDDYDKEVETLERKVVRSQQIHACSKRTCLQFDRQSNTLKCKRRAPFPLAEDDFIEPNGEWGPKRSYGRINNWCPGLILLVKANHDIKLLTSGADTKNVTWYITEYATKNQRKAYNLSALLAEKLAYHMDDTLHVDDIRKRNQLLLFRCFQLINREAEKSAPQVVSYLMGWGDTFKSHQYIPIYWSSVVGELIRQCPELKNNSQRHLYVV